MKTKISTEIGTLKRFVGEERAIELYAKAGFDAWDFSMFDMGRYDDATGGMIHSDHPLQSKNYTAFARKLRRIGEDNGVHCNQTHAPFPTACLEIRGMLKRAIECTAIVGADICVVHPCHNYNAEQNAEMFLEILPFAKGCGVKIAVENVWEWDKEKDEATGTACSHHLDFLAHINAVNDPNLVACLDIGHAEMRGLGTSAEDMILTLGNHLQALHIHDNDKWRDWHEMPYTMNIDFDLMLRSLRKKNYQGYLTMEVDSFRHPNNPDNIANGIKTLYTTARRLADAYDAMWEE